MRAWRHLLLAFLLAPPPLAALARGGPPGGAVYWVRRQWGDATLQHGAASLNLALASFDVSTAKDGRRTISLRYRDSSHNELTLSFVASAGGTVDERTVEASLRSSTDEARTLRGSSHCTVVVSKLTDTEVNGSATCAGVIPAAGGAPPSVVGDVVFSAVKRW